MLRVRHAFPLVAALAVTSLSCLAQPAPDAARTTTRVLDALNSLESFTPADPYATPSPGDADLGEQLLLTPSRSYRPLSIGGSYTAAWTSNAFYTPSSPASDVIMSLGADALALPHLGGNFFFEGSAGLRGYRYFRNPELDFNALEATAGLLRVFREFWDVGLYSRYEYTYLFGRNSDSILQEHSLAVGARKTFQFTRANALFLSAEAAFSLGGVPSFALTHEFNLFAAHQVQWTRALSTSFFYQMTIFDFRDTNRADLRNFLGLSADVQPLKWLTFSATTWLGWNASNESEFDFFVANLGGSVSASINF